MQLGMVGLGRMGSNLTRRLIRHGHEVVAYDLNEAAVRQLAGEGAVGAGSFQDLVAKLERPRAVWVMVPAAVAGQSVFAVAEQMDQDDVVIDGGNTYYRDDIERFDALAQKGIHYLDVGTSGGVFGLDRGFCLMIGGDRDIAERLDPVFSALAPGVDAAARTPGRERVTGSTAEAGYLYCGPPGAGHFVKMVHNGIEYGLMAAYAEGLGVLRKANIGMSEQAADAETTPLREPEFYRYEIDTTEVAEVWRRGSVVASWLLDLTAAALLKDPQLDDFTGRVSDSGEGRWTIQAAVDEGVPANVLTAALFERFSSRGEGEFSNRLLSAMRHEFGGHQEKP